MPRFRAGLIGATALATALFPGAAFAFEEARVTVETVEGGTRVLVTYDEAGLGAARPQADASITSSVLIAEFSTPVEADVSGLVDAFEGRAAMARLDPDGGALRIALRQPAEAHVSASYNMIAIDLTEPGEPAPAPIVSPREIAEREAAERAAAEAAAPPPAAPALDVSWRTGQATEYTRIEFTWPARVGYQLTQEEGQAEIVFDQPASIDLARLSGSPPRLMTSVEESRDGDRHRIRFGLEPEVRARAWDEGNRVIVDLLDPTASSAADLLAALSDLPETDAPAVDDEGDAAAIAAAQAEAEAEAETPAPANLAANTADNEPAPAEDNQPARIASADIAEFRQVRAAVSEASGEVRAEFAFPGAVGAAVFRRGEAIWIVFDAVGELELSEFSTVSRSRISGFDTVAGENWTAARIIAPASSQAEARLEGDRWTIVFSERITSPPRPIQIRREAAHGQPGRIRVSLDGVHRTVWIRDPEVGDRLGVITARAPVQGLAARRDFVGAALLPSALGVAVEPRADDLQIRLIPRGAEIGRPDGLDLTPGASGAMQMAGDSALRAVSPAFMDYDSWRGDGRFAETWPEMQRRASMEEGADGRLALARYALAHGLAPEALGMLREAIHVQPQLAEDAHVRAMQGVASIEMGRIEEAADYFTLPALIADPAAAPWRGLIAMERQRWEDARQRFDQADTVLYYLPADLRGRFRVAHARAALEVGDFAAAGVLLEEARREDLSGEAAAEAELIDARISAASGDVDRAVEILSWLAESGMPPVEARALAELYRIQLEDGRMTLEEGVEALEGLRYRWRGDEVELNAVYALGQLYIREGDYAQGLSTLQSARIRYPDSRTSRRIGEEMSDTFEYLFLEGGAERIDPIEAVALFYQFSDLTPIGARGDQMIRRLADRLIAFDLLNPAAELLEHQVENRLREPVARARVATDLAVVYLMDRRYEDALNAIRGTRIAGLPTDLVEERYLLEARAFAELGRYQQAQDLVSGITSPSASRLRADIAWEERDWGLAGRRLEAILGDRWRDPDPLDPADESDLLRSAIAYSLAAESAGSARLAERYGEHMAASGYASAFELLTDAEIRPGDVRIRELADQIAGIDTLDAFMEEFRARFAETSAS